MRNAIFVVFILLLAIGQLHGVAETDNSQPTVDINNPLSLTQCIKIALQQSASIMIADLDLRTAKLNLDDARSNYLPTVNISGLYRFSDKIDFGWEQWNYDAQVTASYTIWDHGRRQARLAQAKASEKSVKTDYERTRQNLIYNITQAYYNLLQAEKLIDVQEKLLEISKGNVDRVKAFEELGRAVPADVAAAKVQQGNEELALINALNNLDLARSRLASIMGLDPATNIILEEDPDYKIYTEAVLPTSEASLEDSVVKAIENRPELKRLKYSMDSLRWSLLLTRMDRWPVLSADFNYNIAMDDYLRDRDNFDKYRSWSVVARISFPIFDDGISMRREKSAEIGIEQLKEDITNRERSIMLEIQQAYLNLERTRKSLEIAKERVKNATESLNATQSRYEQNMVIFLEVLSAQTRYAEALINQVRAFYDYQMAVKALDRAMGILGVE